MKAENDILKQILDSYPKSDRAPGLYAQFLIKNPSIPFPKQHFSELQEAFPTLTSFIPRLNHNYILSYYLYLLLVKFHRNEGNDEDIKKLKDNISTYFIYENTDDFNNAASSNTANLLNLQQLLDRTLDIMWILYSKNDTTNSTLTHFQSLYNEMYLKFFSLYKGTDPRINQNYKYNFKPIYNFILKMMTININNPEKIIESLLTPIPGYIIIVNLKIFSRLLHITRESKNQYKEALINHLNFKGIPLSFTIMDPDTDNLDFEIIIHELEAQSYSDHDWKDKAIKYINTNDFKAPDTLSNRYHWSIAIREIRPYDRMERDELLSIVIMHSGPNALKFFNNNYLTYPNTSLEINSLIDYLYKLPDHMKLESWDPFELVLFIKEIHKALYVDHRIDFEESKSYIATADKVTMDYVKIALIAPPLKSFLGIKDNRFFNLLLDVFEVKSDVKHYLSVIDSFKSLKKIIHRLGEQWADFIKCLEIPRTHNYLFTYRSFNIFISNVTTNELSEFIYHMNKFKEAFNRLQEISTNENLKMEFYAFIIRHSRAIFKIICILGVDALLLMKKHLTTSFLLLERMIDTYIIYFDEKINHKFTREVLRFNLESILNMNAHSQFDLFLEKLAFISKLPYPIDLSITPRNLDDLLPELDNIIFDKMKSYLNIKNDINHKTEITSQTSDWSRLISANIYDASKEIIEIHKHFLRNDLGLPQNDSSSIINELERHCNPPL